MSNPSNLPPGCPLSAVDGSGECSTCGGSGEIENLEFDINDPESSRMLTCPDCDGSGEKVRQE
jgi:DnaJ-class molecular chaperone